MAIIKSPLKTLLLGAALAAITACSNVTVEQYRDNAPQLVAEQFFNGVLRAHGIVKNRNGAVIRYFNATLNASWTDGIGTIDEQFIFDDGEQQSRVWTFTPTGKDTYIATAGDVVGEGTMKIAGNSLFLNYVLRIPYGDGTLDLGIDDRMYLVSEQVLVNESIMSKWGVEVGQITLVIIKE